MKTIINLGFNPTDSRINVGGGIMQTLTKRMGTGGNQVPLVLEIDDERANNSGIEPESCNDNQ